MILDVNGDDLEEWPEKCPLCQSELVHGFGLAYGGYGGYSICTADCPWFCKESSTQEDLEDSE